MKKYIIIASIILSIVYLCYILGVFDKTEIHKLEVYTEISDQGKTCNEVYVVSNPPKNLKDFKELVTKFNLEEKRDQKHKWQTRLFIKDHSNSILDWIWGNNINYRSDSPPKDVDNIDFLGETYLYDLPNGKDTIEYVYYSGDIWYYK